MFRAGCIVPVEVPKESVRSVGLRKQLVLGDLGNPCRRKPDVQSSVGSHLTHPSKLSVQLPLADMQCWMGKWSYAVHKRRAEVPVASLR